MPVTQVGFVGPGQLGLPMVRRLLTAGHQVQVLARRQAVRDELDALGAMVVSTAREAATGCPVVVACLFSDAQLVEVCAGPEGLLAGLDGGAVLASHVTGTRATVRSLAERAPGPVVDAPVSGTAQDVAAGRLTVLLGGSQDAVRRCSEVMSAYAGRLLPVGDLGAALAVKLVNNLLFAAHSQLAVAAVELGAQLGVDRATLLGALEASSARSYAVTTLGGLADTAAFAAAAGPFLRKDVAACEAELSASGAHADLILDVVRRGALALT